MIRVALCDDELSVLDELRDLLDRYREERSQEIQHTAFQSSLELLSAIEKGARFDILLLDVLMPGQLGLNAAAEIRNLDKNVKIIFLTASSEFAVQSYTVGAYYYQLKPFAEADIFRLLDSAIAACEQEREHSLILRCKDGITRIELKKLEYCEVIHRTLFIHLTGGKVLESTGSLDGLCKQLERYGCFFRMHRSYLINLEHVQSLTYHSVTMACQTEIPLPRGKYHDVKEAYLKHMCNGGEIMV